MSKFVFFCISDSCECESLHSKCPSHTLSEHTLTWCSGPIFHVFSYFARCRCDIDLRGVLVFCINITLMLIVNIGYSLLWHLLIAGCDIGVQISVRPSIRPSTFTSKFGFLDISDSCESETLHSNCP